MSDSHFSDSYAVARKRFLEAANSVGGEIRSHELTVAECEQEMAIDVVTIGAESDRVVVVSSGVHGVEGFAGSAIQLALLQQLKDATRQHDVRFVLVHAVNPFGFACCRRFNEDNIDLNRNFLLGDQVHSGSPPGYAALDGFLNPKSPPSAMEPFRLKAAWYIFRNGMQTLKQAIAGGQYEYPAGIFFGGHGPSRTMEILRQHCAEWFRNSSQSIHVDLHTGLGPFGDYRLLIGERESEDAVAWYGNAFGDDAIERPRTSGDRTAYAISGSFVEWMQAQSGVANARFVTAEFGTYDVVRVLASIRSENRAHHYGDSADASFRAVKHELLECFCPRDPQWRRQVVESGLKIIEQAARAV